MTQQLLPDFLTKVHERQTSKKAIILALGLIFTRVNYYRQSIDAIPTWE